MSSIKKSKKKGNKKRVLKKKTGKKSVKKVLSKKTAKSSAKNKKDIIGEVTHYFGHVNAAAVKLKKNLAVGDAIRIKGHTTDFTQSVTSMQLDHQPISVGKKGQEIGLEVNDRVRAADQILRPKGVSS